VSFVSPTNRDPGTIITSSIWNQDVVANVIYLKGGEGTIAFDAGATFSGVVTATAGVVATTLSTSGLIKAGGGIVSETNISAFGTLNIAGTAPLIQIVANSGSAVYQRFGVLGSSIIQVAATGTDSYFDYGGTSGSLFFRQGIEGAATVTFTKSGNITVLSGATVDGVDVSALNIAFSGDVVLATSGATVCKTGTYTGNDTSGNVATGFACGLVEIFRNGAGAPDSFTVFAKGTTAATMGAVWHHGSGHTLRLCPILHATDGFDIGHDIGHANESGATYDYVAFRGTPAL
jgi:hypothetical protein